MHDTPNAHGRGGKDHPVGHGKRLADRVRGESMTGGLIAVALTSVSGASKVFFAGGVFYDTQAKIQLLEIPATFFEEFSVYSPECALKMAEQWRAKTAADFCIATTGEAESSGEGKTGHAYFGAAFSGGSEAYQESYIGARQLIQDEAALTALRFLHSMMKRKLP